MRVPWNAASGGHRSDPVRTPGATATAAAALVGLAGFMTLGCDDSGNPLAPGEVPAALTVTIETQSFVFHHAPGDQVDTQWQEQYHAWASGRLGVSMPGKIDYFKYRTRGELGAAIGRQTNGWADVDQMQVHTIWPRDDHETVHVYVSRLGRPTYLFNEGIAVAHQVDPVGGRSFPMWNNRHVHAIARQHRNAGTLPALGSLIGGDDFWDLDSNVTYPVAGSFVFFLIEEHGIEPIVEYCRRSPDWQEPASATRSRFAAVYGMTLEDAERAWHAMLDAFPG